MAKRIAVTGTRCSIAVESARSDGKGRDFWWSVWRRGKIIAEGISTRGESLAWHRARIIAEALEVT